MEGIRYWKPMKEVIWEYYIHPESKFDGSMGILERRHIQVGEVIHIGKESNKLEVSNIMGVGREGYEFFDNGVIGLSKEEEQIIFGMSYQEAEKCGIPQREYYYIKDKIKKGIPIFVPEILHSRLTKLLQISSPVH